MSLYNLVKGFNPNAKICLGLLRLQASDIPRFRDAWLTDDGMRIIVLTRSGGNNRRDYEKENETLRQRASYLSDHDDECDSTFAHFIYSVPAEYQEYTKVIAEVLALAGKGEAYQGPRAMVELVTNPEKLPKSRIKSTDPRIKAATDAYGHILELGAKAGLWRVASQTPAG